MHYERINSLKTALFPPQLDNCCANVTIFLGQPEVNNLKLQFRGPPILKHEVSQNLWEEKEKKRQFSENKKKEVTIR